jgi:transcriptional regulator with XRE-family HTH domain
MSIAERRDGVGQKPNLSQEGFDKRLGVRKSTISRYESGAMPGDEIFSKIAELRNTGLQKN